MAEILDAIKQRILKSDCNGVVSSNSIYTLMNASYCMGTIRNYLKKLENEGFLKFSMKRGMYKWYTVVPLIKESDQTKTDDEQSLQNLYDLIKQISKTQVDKYVELFLQTRLQGIISNQVSEIVKQEFHEEIIPALMTAVNNETETKVNESHDRIVKIVLNSERRILAKLSLAAKTFLG